MVPLEPLGRTRAVAWPVVQLVVDLVVRRHPGDGGVAVEDRDPVAAQEVQRLRAPHAEVVVVVADHSRGEEHEQGHRIHDRMHLARLPVHHRQRGSERQIEQRPTVGTVA